MIVTGLRATPVAIKDPPLRSAFGLHAPFALRTIVEIETDEGVVGIAETYGGRAPQDAFAAIRALVVGRNARDLVSLRTAIDSRGRERAEGWPWEARKFGPAALFSAIEVACLDAIGRLESTRVCDLLGGATRERVDFAAYLFFKHGGADEWGEVMTPEAIVEEARTMRQRYGYRSLKLKGGVLEPDREVEAIRLLRDAFGPAVPLRLDPNAAWSEATAVRVAERIAGSLQYLEDPVPGIDGMAAVARRTHIPLATNMCVTSFGHLPEAIAKRAVAIVLSDHHMWGGLRATVELGRICETFGLGLSMHSNSHLGISLAAMVHVAAAVPNLTYACDTHYPWQTEEVITGGKLAITDGAVSVPRGAGLGVELDRDALGALHEQYLRAGLAVRDDALEMRKVDPSWRPHVGDW
ncbi:MAG TPA: enolase C-terminal domain-like protein [Candidatus Limnocylindria bacterium]|nr:enolase C-terminal domain-like protein [Candidatus Limnocylindria bacterium]